MGCSPAIGGAHVWGACGRPDKRISANAEILYLILTYMCINASHMQHNVASRFPTHQYPVQPHLLLLNIQVA